MEFHRCIINIGSIGNVWELLQDKFYLAAT